MSTKQQLDLLKEVELKLDEMAKDKEFKEKFPLEGKELKGVRLVVSSIIRRLESAR
ncbi:hypothetical protein NQT62_09580 [Limnobacter humi]|uniref:50S ribosomal protein L29 n=1 Tax=Limnobacter humi TaxID=1778671 RepID=A0ABT1WGN1_9BURK|nr:hypothetical protein [Limnobacter humi]MCQ8896681.1 hypothetical protein [Limnobacter humi]